ncbi:MAG: RdgB/HAM1 family non-canonical purine NTP pyrophosphatase [Candidatus Margulisiibacteriota bacterium]
MRSNEILLATSNKHKVGEIKKILNIKGLKLLSLLDLPGKFSVKESGKTFMENAVKKARSAAKRFRMPCLSDDSGLHVNALSGMPGVRSARFVKPPVTPERLCKKLLFKMKDVPAEKRGARFVCCVAFAYPSGKTYTVEGDCPGSIGFAMKGSCGFGYDPVFIPKGMDKTFAQISGKQKNLLSHRGKAFRKMRKCLVKNAV